MSSIKLTRSLDMLEAQERKMKERGHKTRDTSKQSSKGEEKKEGAQKADAKAS